MRSRSSSRASSSSKSRGKLPLAATTITLASTPVRERCTAARRAWAATLYRHAAGSIRVKTGRGTSAAGGSRNRTHGRWSPGARSIPQRGFAMGVSVAFPVFALAEPSQIQRHIVPDAAPDRSGIDTACTVRVRWMLALDVPDGRVYRGMGIIFLCTISVQTPLKGT